MIAVNKIVKMRNLRDNSKAFIKKGNTGNFLLGYLKNKKASGLSRVLDLEHK